MKKISLVLSLLFLTGCVNRHVFKQFYVRSESNGYYVAIDNVETTITIGQPFSSPIDADIVVKELNRDMEGHWER